MGLKLYTAPATELVTTAEAKAQLRIDFSDDDSYIDTLIAAARKHVEDAELSSALITQTWELTLDSFPATPLVLPRPPLQSITSISYTDIDGDTAVVSSSAYLIDTTSWPGRLLLKSGQAWPTVTLREAGGVTIRFVAGYGDEVGDVPTPIKQAVLLMIGDWYENRENAPIIPGVMQGAMMPFAAKALLSSYRRRQF